MRNEMLGVGLILTIYVRLAPNQWRSDLQKKASPHSKDRFFFTIPA